MHGRQVSMAKLPQKSNVLFLRTQRYHLIPYKCQLEIPASLGYLHGLAWLYSQT